MAQRTVTSVCVVIAAITLAVAPGLALAQEQVGPQDLTRTTADPVEKLVGVWRVDRVEGNAPAAGLKGHVFRIDRQSVATLTLGTCTNPGFTEKLGSIDIGCVGQSLASAAWDPQQPGTLQWSEAGIQAVLHRISGTEALDSPPPAAAPNEGGEEGAAGDDEGTDEGAGDAQ
jgi:hypothetical protein